MAFENISPNMNLPIPGVGQTLGPTWATDLNNSLTLIDQHNHTSGYGVPIPPSGLNINADLTMNNNNLIAIKSLRITPGSILAGASDLACLFVNAADLYYNDGVGNHVRITQNGGVAGTPGSISNLTSPASASYVAANETFVWQSDANTPANMDNASIILRNLSANSFGLTLNPPAAMGADYNLTLPALPASQKIMTLDASGNMAAPYSIDNVTLQIAANVIQVKNTNVTTVAIDTTITPSNAVYLVDTTAGDITMTLPTAVGGSRPYTIKKVSSDSNKVILATTAGQTIDGVASGTPQLSAVNDSITLQSNSTDFDVIGRYLNPLFAEYGKGSNQTIPNGVVTRVALASATGNAVTFNGNGSITIKYDGYYSLSANLSYAQNASGTREVIIDKNGTTVGGQSMNGVSSTINNSLSASFSALPLLAGDTISLYTLQFSGGALDLIATTSYNNSLTIARTGVVGSV